MKFYKPIYFKAEEFLPPHIFEQFREQGLYLFMDSRILWTMDALRIKLGSAITINDYCFGGIFTQRGFRDESGVGAQYSQHRFGRACDFIIKGTISEEFRTLVRSGNLDSALQYITRIENGTPHNHIDCAGVKSDSIIFFNP
jgi:hypothetical protein